ncbi:MAG: SusC/RagA family TonB-linked outer membrane protein [Bacteroidota bacterium]
MGWLLVALLYTIYAPAQVSRELASETPLPLVEVLSMLEKERNISFLYEASLLDDLRVNQACPYSKPIKQVLECVFTPLDLQCQKVGRRSYVIRSLAEHSPRDARLTDGSPTKSTMLLRGHLQDEEGNALIGGTLFIMGTDLGTTTNAEGYFSINIPQSEAIVRISYIGFQDRYLEVKQAGTHNITLAAMTNTLQEVVVTALGQEVSKEEIGYAVDEVGEMQLQEPTAYNLTAVLAAQTPGVWATNSAGSPGASSSIIIRGFRSINGSNQPLYVLDGMPVDNTSTGNSTTGVDVSNRLIDLNVQDIESVSILRGASAAALYGIRAANGAILITSKRGTPGPPRITFESAVGVDFVNQLPGRQQDYSQGVYSNGEALYRGPESNVNTSYGPRLSELEFDGTLNYPYDQNGNLVPKGSGNGLAANQYDPYTTFFVPGGRLRNHLSIRGGNQQWRYYVSGGHLRHAGVVPNAFFERTSFKGVLEFKPIEKLTLGWRPNYTWSHSQRMKKGGMFSGITLGLFRSPNTFDIGNGLTGRQAADTPSSYSLPHGLQRSYRANGSYDNPFWTINRNPYFDNVHRHLQQFSVEYELAPAWTIIYRAGMDHYIDRREDAFDINSGSYPLGFLNHTRINFQHFNSDLLLRFERSLGPDWEVKSTLGHSYFTSSMAVNETRGDQLERAGVYLLSNAVHLTSQESLLNKKIASVFGDFTFAYRKWLFVNFSARNDWSSTLPAQNNSFFYPGLNLSTVFTSWLQQRENPALTFAKLRASASLTGNDAGVYLTDTYFRPAVAGGDNLLPTVRFPAFGVTAMERSTTLGNRFLRPESSRNLELGMVLEWWNGRLAFDASWYWNQSRDQIVNAQLSAATGYLRSPINGGQIDTKGAEVQVKMVPVRNTDWEWSNTINFSRNRSIVTELPMNSNGIVLGSYTNLSTVMLEGQPYGVMIGTSIKRNEAGIPIIDEDGFPLLNKEQTVVGDPNPDWLMGIHQRLRYKRFSCFMLWDIRKGGDIWNGTRGVLSYLGISETSGDRRDETVVFDGVTASGEVNTRPVALANPANGMSGIYWRRYGFLGLAEEHVEEVSWLRLRTVGMEYTFSLRPRPSGFQPTLAVGLSAYNVLLFTNYTGVDPDTNLRGDSNIRGWDYFNSPGTAGGEFRIRISL